MNISHLKYAVEIEKAGSINKASENLFMNQPNLSRALRELEASLGIKIFVRSPKGMVPTTEGREFLTYARQILHQLDAVENMYRKKLPRKQRFSVSVPRASYISEAFAQFSKSINAEPSEVFYRETNSLHAIENILSYDYNLGILRYSSAYDGYFAQMLAEKELEHRVLAEFTYVLVMSETSPLAEIEIPRFSDLESLIEIAHADPYVPSMPLSAIKKEELPDNARSRIFVYERASQFDLLSENPDTFMWVSPIPQKLLRRYGLVQRPCADNIRLYRDVLIHRRDYRLSELDERFIREVKTARDMYLINKE